MLPGKPFEDFELLDETLSRTKLDEHAQPFKDREKIAQLLLFGVTSSSSYKVVLHGEAGVGKSSLLNKVLHGLRQAGYFGIKHRVNVASAEDGNLFERELSRMFGEEMVREARRSHRFLKSIVQPEKRNRLHRQFVEKPIVRQIRLHQLIGNHEKSSEMTPVKGVEA